MSFDDRDDMIPRNAPQPAPFIEATAKPTVPEVSLLFDQEKSSRFTNPNRSILKGSPSSNSQQSKAATNSTPTEPYNTWRWKGLSYQNANNGVSDTKNDIHRSPLRVDNQHRDDSNFRNGFQLPTSRLQQQIFEFPTHINFENRYNYQSSEPVQSKSNTSYGIHNVSDQYDHLQRQPEFHQRHEFTHPKPPANSVQHCLSPHRIHSNTNGTISDFNKKCTQINLERNKFEMYRPTNNTVPNYHSNNESRLGNEPQVDRSVYRPTFVHEGNKLYHDKGIKLDVSQNEEFRTSSNSTNMIGISSNRVFNNSHDQNCSNHIMSHHAVSNSHRINPYTISHNTIHNPLRSCDSFNCTHTDNQNFVKDMISIIQTQNVQILKLQDQINQLIQLHSNCHKSKDKVDVSVQFDSPNSYLGKGRRTKGTVLENLPIIEEHSDTVHIGAFQNGHFNKISVAAVTSDLTPAQLDSNKLNVPKNCHCDCKTISLPTKITETSPRGSDLQNVHVGCNNENSSSSDRKGKRTNLPHHNEDQTAMDRSFTLNEADLAIGTIAEQMPSPTSSVHVDMQEYNSSSYEDSCSSESSSEERDSEEAQVGWTFYDNVLGQVNNILNKKANSSKPPPDSFDAVRNATIEHFRNMGISFTDIDNTLSKKVTFDAKHTPQYDTDDKNETDVTMHFNAVAMQCLKDELGTKYPDKMQDFMMCNVASGNANLSFATLRYLERYHLLPKNQDQMVQERATTSKQSQKIKKRKKKPKVADPTWYQPRKPTAKNSVGSKILDITTLKQQPKLL